MVDQVFEFGKRKPRLVSDRLGGPRRNWSLSANDGDVSGLAAKGTAKSSMAPALAHEDETDSFQCPLDLTC